MKKYLLFDLDGTLTDPKIGITTCVQYALHSFGIEEPDLDKLEPFIGPPLRDSFMEFYGFTAKQAEEAVAKYRERFQDTGLFENEVYDGIPEMLKTLQSKGYFLAVASSKPQVYVERILEHFDLKKYFSVVVGSELDGRRETKDQVVQETLRQLFGENPVDPAQVYMIGDRKFDVEGARALGVESVGVTYGYGSKEELKEAKADYIVQSVEELEKFLLRGSEELLNGNPDNKKKNPMYQRIWTMVYSFLMFILVRNAVQYALLALLYQLAQSGASGGLVDLLILRDETGAYNGYSGDVSSIIAALGFIGGAIAVWSTAKMLIDKNKEDMHLSHLKKEGKSKYVLLTVATISAVIGCNLLFELLGVTNKSEAYTEVAAQQYSAHFIVGILVFGFISPIAEELLFRGVIYGYLRGYQTRHSPVRPDLRCLPHELRPGRVRLSHRLPDGICLRILWRVQNGSLCPCGIQRPRLLPVLYRHRRHWLCQLARMRDFPGGGSCIPRDASQTEKYILGNKKVHLSPSKYLIRYTKMDNVTQQPKTG
mgnify:CR=1 FL=1